MPKIFLVPQPILPTIISLILAPTILIYVIVRTISTFIKLVQTVSRPVVFNSFVYAPTNKEKVSTIKDDYDLPLSTFEVGSSSCLTISYS